MGVFLIGAFLVPDGVAATQRQEIMDKLRVLDKHQLLDQLELLPDDQLESLLQPPKNQSEIPQVSRKLLHAALDGN